MPAPVSRSARRHGLSAAPSTQPLRALGLALAAGAARQPLPAGLAVGASCHDAEDLRHARRLGCDFAVIGPVLVGMEHQVQIAPMTATAS